MLRIRILGPALGCWMALSFTICVLGVLGFVETSAYGVIAAVLFVPLYNYFAQLYEKDRLTSASNADR